MLGRHGPISGRPPVTRRRPRPGPRAAATPLPDSRFGPIEAVCKLAETLATVLVVERRGEPHGRVLALRPAARHHQRPHVLSAPPKIRSRTSEFVEQVSTPMAATIAPTLSTQRIVPGFYASFSCPLIVLSTRSLDRPDLRRRPPGSSRNRALSFDIIRLDLRHVPDAVA